jgi:hypothetical protein
MTFIHKRHGIHSRQAAPGRRGIMMDKLGSGAFASEHARPLDCGPPSQFAELRILLVPYLGKLEPAPRKGAHTRILDFLGRIFKR